MSLLDGMTYEIENSEFSISEPMHDIDERILCAAIKFGDLIITGYRHSDCYYVLKRLYGTKMTDDQMPNRDDQGFLTSLNRYVDREEAWKIAIKNNQVKFGLSVSDNGEKSILISENLY